MTAIVYGFLGAELVFLPAEVAKEWAEGRVSYEVGPATVSLDLLGEELAGFGFVAETQLGPGRFVPREEAPAVVAHLESLGHEVSQDDFLIAMLSL